MNYYRMMTLALLLLVLNGSSHAQSFGKPKPNFNTPAETIVASRGSEVQVRVTAQVPFGYHIYTARIGDSDVGPVWTAFELQPASIGKISGVRYSLEPIRKLDSGFNIEVAYFSGAVDFLPVIKIDPAAPLGIHSAKLKLEFQLCTDNACLPPDQAELNLNFEILEAPNSSGSQPDPPVLEKTILPSIAQVSDSNDLNAVRAKGLWNFLYAAAAAGALALLTPCVFPMIPITVSFFTKRTQFSRVRSLRDAAIYCAGIVFTFTGIGFVFSLFLGASGIARFAADPFVNLAIAALFIALAMNLFGVFEIRLPTGVLNRLDRKAGQGEGIFSILLMALVFSITSFTCTAPFVGTVMVWAAQGEWLWPTLGTLAFSTVFALPFFVLAAFPMLLKGLPKSGGWLNAVKVTMGFLELAAALKFISSADLVWQWGLLTRELFLSCWAAIMLLTALYLLGVFQFANDTKVEHVGGLRIVFATIFLSLAIWFFGGLFGKRLGELDAFIPPAIYPGKEDTATTTARPGKADELSWYLDWELALAKAKETGQSIFVDFTGYTCANCRLMESAIFTQPQVKTLLAQYVRAKLYTDDKSNPERSLRYQQMQHDRFQTVTLPFYALLDPTGKTIATFAGMTRDADAYARFLEKGLR